jgi:hypothetical protein
MSIRMSFFLGDLNIQRRPIALIRALKSFQFVASIVGSSSCRQIANSLSMNLFVEHQVFNDEVDNDNVDELVDCDIEAGNVRGGKHAHCNTADLMVDEVTKLHSVVLHYYNLHWIFFLPCIRDCPKCWLGKLRFA